MALYVGDLDPSVTEGQLFHEFSKMVGFTSVVLCRDSLTGQSLCYGFVNFNDNQSASAAMKIMNHVALNGKPMRVMWSLRDFKGRNSGLGNLFVKNLDESIGNSRLQEIFSEFGNIMSCKVEVSQDGKSKGYGYVQFESIESADLAITKLNGAKIGKKEIYVGHFMRKSDRIKMDGNYTNLYLKNLDETVTEEILEKKCSEFGKVTSLVIAKDSNAVSKGFGFVNFENPEDAKRAKESMNGAQLGSKALYVARAQKKIERERMLLEKYKGSNVYVKNINEAVDEEELKQLFNPCGRVISARIMRTDKGINRGFGFVGFSRKEEADLAIKNLNGFMFYGKPLYVCATQTKEERKEFLEKLLRTKRAHHIFHPAFYFLPPWRPNPPIPPFGPLRFRSTFPRLSPPTGFVNFF